MEHPFRNPSLHIETGQISIEDFVIKSLAILRKINLEPYEIYVSSRKSLWLI